MAINGHHPQRGTVKYNYSSGDSATSASSDRTLKTRRPCRLSDLTVYSPGKATARGRSQRRRRWSRERPIQRLFAAGCTQITMVARAGAGRSSFLRDGRIYLSRRYVKRWHGAERSISLHLTVAPRRDEGRQTVRAGSLHHHQRSWPFVIGQIVSSCIKISLEDLNFLFFGEFDLYDHALMRLVVFETGRRASVFIEPFADPCHLERKVSFGSQLKEPLQKSSSQ